MPSLVLGWHEMPLTMQAAFLSVGVEPVEFRRLCEQDWCREWNGWQRVKQDMNGAEVLAWMEHFLRLSTQDATSTVGCVSNEQRLAALAEENLHLCRASSEGCNCLIDSLTIALAAAGFVPRTLLDDPKARLAGCRYCREQLVHSDDPTLRPRWRGASGEVQKVSEHDHANAYLQPEIHGPAVLAHLLHHYRNSTASTFNQFTILTYTRFDGPFIDPYEAAVIVPAPESRPGQAPATQLRLFNHMDARGNGYHFDALIPRTALPGLCGEAQHANAGQSAASRCLSGHSAAQVIHNAGASYDTASRRASTHRHQQSPTNSVGGRSSNIGVTLGYLQHMLQGFFHTRGSSLRITARDAADVEAAGHNSKQLGAVLLTKLQATLYNSDSQPHAAEKLAAAWRRYIFVCNQGPARKLGRTDKEETEHCRAAQQHAAASSQSSGSAPGDFANSTHDTAMATKATTASAHTSKSSKPVKVRSKAARVQTRRTASSKSAETRHGPTGGDAAIEGTWHETLVGQPD